MLVSDVDGEIQPCPHCGKKIKPIVQIYDEGGVGHQRLEKAE